MPNRLYALSVLSLIAALALADVVPLTRAHSHNDYEQSQPLEAALDHGFCSVEADVFLVDGKLLVSHDRKDLDSSGDLDSMYLKPLSKLMEKNGGGVYRTPVEFLLLVDIKADGAEVYEVLEQLLKPYRRHLTHFKSGKVERRALTVILSGDRPTQLLATQKERYAFIDGRPENLVPAKGSSNLMPLISTSWAPLFKWKGLGQMPPQERYKLSEIVRLAYRRRQKLRFWATPEDPTVWRELADACVDLIGTDRLDDLASFLTTH